jgi:hypothetical protein
MPTAVNEKRLTWLSLFASFGTLLCCALPIGLVALGLGATVAAISSNLPFLVTLTVHKGWVFAASGALLAISAWLMFRPGRSCPADPEIAALCERTWAWSRRVFWTSASIWSLGFFAAYLALPLRIWLDR